MNRDIFGLCGNLGPEGLPFIHECYITKTLNWKYCPFCQKIIKNRIILGWNWYCDFVPEDLQPVMIMECPFCQKKYCYHNDIVVKLMKSFQKSIDIIGKRNVLPYPLQRS